MNALTTIILIMKFFVYLINVGLWGPWEVWKCLLEQFQTINNATRLMLEDKLVTIQFNDGVLGMKCFHKIQKI